MNCLEFRRNISDYLDGALSADAKAGFEKHADGCRRCRAELARQRLVRECLAKSPKVVITNDRFRTDLMYRIRLGGALFSGIKLSYPVAILLLAAYTLLLAGTIVGVASYYNYLEQKDPVTLIRAGETTTFRQPSAPPRQSTDIQAILSKVKGRCRMKVNFDDADDFFKLMFEQYVRHDIDASYLKPFAEQSSVFDGAYIRYDLRPMSFLEHPNPPIIVFRQDPRHRVLIRVKADEAQKLVDYINAANKIAVQRAAAAALGAEGKGVDVSAKAANVSMNAPTLRPDADGDVVLELDFIGL